MFRICIGTVRPFVSGFTSSPFIQHFGRAAYDRSYPILPDSLQERVEPIVLALNDGTITQDEGRKRLKSL